MTIQDFARKQNFEMQDFDQMSFDANYLYYLCDYAFDTDAGGEIVATKVVIKIDRHIDWEIIDPVMDLQHTMSLDLASDGSETWHDDHARQTLEDACLEQAYKLYNLLG